MDNVSPKNIALWAMHRSGSTHFGYRLRNSLRQNYANTKYLGEATGWGGLIPYESSQTTFLEEMMEQITRGGDYVCDRASWKVEDGIIVSSVTHGSVVDEIRNRLDIIKTNAWSDSIVFKMHPWPYMEDTFNKYADAVIKNDNFSHVLLWRKSLYDYMCSRFILRQKKTPHGSILLDDTSLEFRSEQAQGHFLNRVSKNLDEFVRMAELLKSVKDNVIMVETISLNDIHTLSIGQKSLVLTPPEQVKMGSTVYLDKDGQRHLPRNIITVETQEILRRWADTHTEKYDWENLDKNLGFKTA